MGGGEGVKILSRILTSVLSLMTWLCRRKAEIYAFVSEELELY